MADPRLKKYVSDAAAEGVGREDAEPFCISFQKKNREVVCFPYGMLIWATFNPSGKLQLHFSSHTVTVEGSGLEVLYRDLLVRKLREVVVSAGRHDLAPTGEPSDEPVVKEITVIPASGPGKAFTLEPADDKKPGGTS